MRVYSRDAFSLNFWNSPLFRDASSRTPEDELCVPGRDNIDPVVCAMLAEINRSNGDFLLEENVYQIENIATRLQHFNY